MKPAAAEGWVRYYLFDSREGHTSKARNGLEHERIDDGSRRHHVDKELARVDMRCARCCGESPSLAVLSVQGERLGVAQLLLKEPVKDVER